MNSGLRCSAARIISPSSRAGGASFGQLQVVLDLADWWPAVTRPSTHSAASSRRRACATCSAVRTSGT